jgi:hypothetical protein
MITAMGADPGAPITSVYSPAQLAGKDADTSSITVLQQCIAEQVYVRDGITRSLIYNQVRPEGMSGQDTPSLWVPSSPATRDL